MCLYQLYKRYKIAKVKQVNGDSDPADTITKSKLLLALKRLINTNQIKLKIVEWVKYATDNSIDLKEKCVYRFFIILIFCIFKVLLAQV